MDSEQPTAPAQNDHTPLSAATNTGSYPWSYHTFILPFFAEIDDGDHRRPAVFVPQPGSPSDPPDSTTDYRTIPL